MIKVIKMIKLLIDHLASVVAKARMRWSVAPGVSQVVKTAQSRGRTERTLLSSGTLARRQKSCGRA
jgi:hypothetical protein